jgi:serine/threonine-protein kinase
MKSVEELLSFLDREDRYTDLHELGEGAMGHVMAVFDTSLQRVVACKSINRERLDNPSLVQTFLNEMRLMGRLNHPGILSLYDGLKAPTGEPAYTMKLAEGESLTELLKVKPGSPDSEPLPLEQAVRILVKLGEALAYAHDRGVLHLDLKPDNIMIGHYGEVWIMDWGAARVYDPERYKSELRRFMDDFEEFEPIEESGHLLIGTPSYMSPEQFTRSRDELRPPSDIFSVGVIFYQMLTGHHPFRSGDVEEARRRVQSYDPPPAHELNLDVPHSLSRICARMMAKKVEERYAGFREVLNDIGEFQSSAAGFPVKEFAPGEIIFSEGDPSDFVCVVESGKVEISVEADGERRVIAMLGNNEPFGELAALTGNPRTATATAVEPSRIRMIGRDDIAAEIDKLSSWVGTMVEALSNRFVEINERLLELERKG